MAKYINCKSPEDWDAAITKFGGPNKIKKVIRAVDTETFEEKLELIFGLERGGHPAYNNTCCGYKKDFEAAGYKVYERWINKFGEIIRYTKPKVKKKEKKMKFGDVVEKTKEVAKQTEVIVVREVKENDGLVGGVTGAVIGTVLIPIPVVGTALGGWIGYKLDKRMR